MLRASLTVGSKARLLPLNLRVKARSRLLATTASGILVRPPPSSVQSDPIAEFDRHLLSILRKNSNNNEQRSLNHLVQDYLSNSGRVLDKSLPYESQPAEQRKVKFESGIDSHEGVVMVAHCIESIDGAATEFKVVTCSGFVIDCEGGTVVTCAHTLEQVRHSPLLETANGSQVVSGSFIISRSSDGSSILPVEAIRSSLPRSDLLLLSLPPASRHSLKSLPVSPYPLESGRTLRAHLITENTKTSSDWEPWIGGTTRTWTRGIAKGYRDFAGRESQPGTYDALNHMLFTPIPTPGSSGGPIVDEENGAVVGMILGSRMDNRVEGVRGWGVPAEVIFEMFSLPGLEGKK